MITRRGDLAALELNDSATVIEIRAAYRRRAKECHPDSGGSSQAMIDLTSAAERLLSDDAYGSRRVTRSDIEQDTSSSLEEAEHPGRRKGDGPAPMWTDDEFDSAFAEPEGLQRILITFVAFPLLIIVMVVLMILIAT